MKKIMIRIILLVVLLFSLAGCQSPNEGAGIGALVGTIGLGIATMHPAGLIGGMIIGGLSGQVVGEALDKPKPKETPKKTPKKAVDEKAVEELDELF